MGEEGGGKRWAGWAFARNTIVSSCHDKCTRIASHSEKSVDKPLGMLNYLGSRSRQTLDSTPAMHPICGQIGYRARRSRSRQDFGQRAGNASNLWPDRLRGLRDEVVEDMAVDVGQASVDAVGSVR
jgi:hypothetical protein